MTHPAGIRRICLMTEDGGDCQDDSGRGGLPMRAKNALDRALRLVGANHPGTWRQDRGDRHLVLLPVGTSACDTVPRLLQSLHEQLEQDGLAVGTPALRLEVSLAQGTVTQARGGYAGQAIVAVSRLLDSTDLHNALSNTPEALFAVIMSDDLYAETIAGGDGTVQAQSYHRVHVDAPDNLWQGVGWVRAWTVLSPSASSPAKKERTFLDGVLSALGGGLNDVATITQAGGNEGGDGGHGVDTGAAHATDIAAHAYGAEHAYAVQDHYTIQEGPGYVQETVVHSGYEDGTGYNSADYHSSSGAEYHSSGDHSGGVV